MESLRFLSLVSAAGVTMSKSLADRKQELLQAGVSQALADRITQYLESTPLPQLARILPFRLADEWSVDRHEVLDAFLHATRAGMTDLQWQIRCTSCLGPASIVHSLQDLHQEGHCVSCQIDTIGTFDETVEVTFRANAAIRDVRHISRIDAVGAQMIVENQMTLSADAGESQTIRMELTPGRYYIFNPMLSIAGVLVVKGPPDTVERNVQYRIGDKLTPGTQTVHPGPVRIEFANDRSEAMSVSFVKGLEYPWVSAAVVATNQNFRDLFVSELVRPGASFGIQNMVLLFTDIKGSTEMYERLGDAKAYALVSQHFEILFETVKRNRGAVVKTIGDAVMATFLRTEDAVLSAMQMHEAFQDFNKSDLGRDDIVIKVGIHRGPTIAVTSNDRLDYFGRTVNAAARVQGLSGGADIMLTRKIFDESGISELAATRKWQITPLQASLKGIQGMVDVIHLTMSH